jgi:CheY-like chemotaxis protein
MSPSNGAGVSPIPTLAIAAVADRSPTITGASVPAPRRRSAPANEEAAPARGRADRKGVPVTEALSHIDRSILIVEDEPMIRIDLVDFFTEEGFAVWEAGDADEASAILAEHPLVQVVLTDIQMPGSMDGLKLAHYIRGRYPPTLLVVASGAVRPTAAELPAHTMFLPKPFDPRFVLGEIRRLTD